MIPWVRVRAQPRYGEQPESSTRRSQRAEISINLSLRAALAAWALGLLAILVWAEQIIPALVGFAGGTLILVAVIAAVTALVSWEV